MNRRLRSGLFLIFVLAGSSGGCRKTLPPVSLDPFQQAEAEFRTGHYDRAAHFYAVYLAQDPSVENRDRALFHLALSHSFPDSSVCDPERAEELFEQLAEKFAESPYGAQARLILDLQENVSALRFSRTEQEKQIRRLRRELERLKAIDMKRPSRAP